jgi:hypothetical protein
MALQPGRLPVAAPSPVMPGRGRDVHRVPAGRRHDPRDRPQWQRQVADREAAMLTVHEVIESIIGYSISYYDVLETVAEPNGPQRPPDWPEQLRELAVAYAVMIRRAFERGDVRPLCELLADFAAELSHRVHPPCGPDLSFDVMESLVTEFRWGFGFRGGDWEAEYQSFKDAMIDAIARQRRRKASELLRKVLYKR